jgi:predicted porin
MAFAQTSTNFYGVADAAMDVVRAKGATASPGSDISAVRRLTSEGSYFGFRGKEAITPTLDAVFQLEGNYSIDTGAASNPLWNRDTFVGLRSSALGGITLGVNTTPTRAIGLAFDLTPGGNTGIGAIQSILSPINGVSTDHDSRLQNSIRYRSLNVGGFEADVIVGIGEARTNVPRQEDDTYGVGLAYKNGRLYASYSFDLRNDKNRTGLAQTSGKDVSHRLGAKYYVAPSWMIGVLFDATDSSGRFGAGQGKVKRNAWAAITSWENGPHEAYFMFAKAADVNCDGIVTGNSVGCDSAGDTGAKMLTLGYNYELSKRVMIRSTISKIANERAARYDFSNGRTGAATGADPEGISVGLRYRF